MASSLLLLVASVLAIGSSAQAEKSERQLIKYLLDNYARVGVHGRPGAGQLEVKYGISLQQVIDLDYRAQAIDLLLWGNMEWEDEYLKWNEKDFDIHSVSIPVTSIYMPDITPYNPASSAELMYPSSAVVYSDGSVNYVPAFRQRFTCPIPPPRGNKEFECTIKVGSWTMDGSKLNLTSRYHKVDTSTYIQHPLWELLGTTAQRNVKVYECCPEPYIDIVFTLRLKYNNK